jgi:hypothetical protein
MVLKKWQLYLIGNEIKLEIDNKSLTYINTLKDKALLDWIDFLLEFCAEIVHKRRVLNVLPYHLSHMYRIIPLDQRNQTIRVQSSSGRSKESSTSEGNDERRKFSMSDRGNVVALSDSDHTSVMMESRINEDHDANMICINEIEMGRE